MPTLTDLTDHLDLPASDLTASTLRYVHDIAEPAIFNHSVRTYLYGRALAKGHSLAAGADYDDELLFLGCVLHDVGLTETGNGDLPFHLDGADLAVRHLGEASVAGERVEVVWDAIALHLDPLVASRKRPEVAFVSAGAGLDLGAEVVPGIDLERIDALLPRHDLGAAIKQTILAQAQQRPHKAPPFTLPGELVRQATGEPWPTWEEMTR